MLYSLLTSLIDNFSFLNIFKYLTVRTGLAMFTSLFVVFLIGTPFINYFSSKKIHNPIRSDGPSEHIVKKIVNFAVRFQKISFFSSENVLTPSGHDD